MRKGRSLWARSIIKETQEAQCDAGVQRGKGLVSGIRSTKLKPMPLASRNAYYPKLNPTVGMTVPLTYQTVGSSVAGVTSYALRYGQHLAECGTQLGLSKYLVKEGSRSITAGRSHPDVLQSSPARATSHPEPWPPQGWREDPNYHPCSAPMLQWLDSCGKEGAVTLYDLVQNINRDHTT